MTEAAVDSGKIDQLGLYFARFRDIPALDEARILELNTLIRAGMQAQEQIENGSTDNHLLEVASQGQDALGKFVEANLKLLVKTATRFTSDRGDLFFELLQEGAIVLIRAAEGFKPELGNQFSSYAVFSIQSAWAEYLSYREAGVLSFSREATRQLTRVNKALNETETSWTSPEAVTRVVAELGVDEEEANDLMRLMGMRNPLSIDSYIDGASIAEFIAGDDDTQASVESSVTSDELREVLGHLPDRERMVLAYQFGFEGADRPSNGQLSFLETAKRALSMLRHPSLESLTRRLSGKPEGKTVSAGECAYIGPEIFYSQNTVEQDQAKVVCGRCALKHYCLEQALRNDESGVWGQTTEDERSQMKRSQK